MGSTKESRQAPAGIGRLGEIERRTRVSALALLAAATCLVAGVGTAEADDAPASPPAKPTQVAQAAPAAAGESSQLEEIVVTARKRAEKLADVPAAVTAFTEEQIENAGIVNPRDFIEETPNVTFVETQNIGTSFVIIRGISQARNSEPSVAVVVDGVQQVNPSQFDQSLFDIQQIEVLKGPQGGLYGRNAIGGAILVTTKQPTDNYEYELKTGIDNGPGVTVLGSASGPVPDTTNLKFVTSMQYQNTDGYIKNTYLNQSADPFEDVDGLFKLIWQANDALTIDGRLSFSRVHTQAYYYNIVNDVNDTSLPVEVNNPGIDDRDLFDASIKVDYNLGFATLTSVSAYDTVEEIDTGDAYNFLPIKQSFFYKIFGFDLNQSQYTNVSAESEDLRLTSPSDQRIKWIGGVYFIHTDRFISTGNMIDTGHGVFPVYSTPSTNPLNPQFSFLADREDNFAWATYGDLTGDITDQLEAALSLRYDSDSRQNTTDTPTKFLPNIPGFPAEYSGEVRNKTFTALQPKFTLRYKPEDNLTLYADWGRGFRSGGFNQTGVGAVAAANGILGVSDIYRAEVANTWEVGAKAEMLDRRLLLDGALYYTTSHNSYFFVYLAANSTQNLGNLGEVVYKGGDFDATYKITERLQASLGFGYTDSDITQDVDPTVIGHQAPDVSKYTLNAALQYHQSVGGDWEMIDRLEYNRIGDTYWDPQNSTVRNPVDLVNARVGFTNGDWSLTLWSKNLFDVHYNAEFSPGGFVFKALPRTGGIEATYRF